MKTKNSAFYNDDQIITSLLDNDFYKFTMMQAAHHHYPSATTTWAFKNRGGEDLKPYKDEIQRQVNLLENVHLTNHEEKQLAEHGLFKDDFIRFLKLFRFDTSLVELDIIDDNLSVRFTGPWVHVILYEIVIMAIISEVRNRALYPLALVDDAIDTLEMKLSTLDNWDSGLLSEFTLADFGTRRRFSKKVQEFVVDYMIEHFKGTFVGTSNVKMAFDRGLKPIGTMAHEWIMAHQQLGVRLSDSQSKALETWVAEYRGDLGIALTDCITTDVFLRDFDLYFAKLFDGLRHDSGDPKVFADKCIQRYEELRILPLSKTLIFSDGLNFDKCYDILKYCHGKIKTSYGMGTALTNDVKGTKPLNMVIKMVECNGQPVAKHSDSPGKGMCEDPDFVEYLLSTFKV